jgi:hypothetical protein
MLIAIKPIAHSDESNIGYALRLALRNGFTYIDRLFSKPILNKIIKGRSVTINPQTILVSKPYMSKQAYIINPLFELSIQIEPKVCLRCIQEKGFINVEVQSPFIHQCSAHHEPLIDQCYTCHSQLTWDVALLKGRCTSKHCGAPLIKHPQEKLPTLMESQVSDCLLASYFLNNSGGTLIKQQRHPNIPNYQEKLREGFEFLNDHSAVRNWMQKSINSHSFNFPISFAAVSINQLSNNLKVIWPVSCVLRQFNSIQRTNTNSEIEPFHVTNSTASQLLGVSAEAIKTLRKNNLIISKEGQRLNYKSIIDISPLIELLATNFIAPDMKSITEQRNSMFNHNICMSVVLLAVSKGDLTVGYKSGPDLSSSIYIKPEDLIKLIDKQKHQNGKLITSKAQKYWFSGQYDLKKPNQLEFNFDHYQINNNV